LDPKIHISPEDFAVITEDGTLCDERGQLGVKEFKVTGLNPELLHFMFSVSSSG
jgi:hypothetical protein